MSKSMGFRNSGKLDLSGKGAEYAIAGALLVVIVVALVFVGTQIWSCDSAPIVEQGKYYVKCTECNAEWEIESKDTRLYHREMEMGGRPSGTDCPKCGGEKTVFLMNRCPKCKKYYLSERVTDPDKFAAGGNREVCPHCGTDLLKWYREHRRKR